MPLYFCSLCFLWLSCLHLPGLLGDPVFAVVALSQRIVLLRVLAFAYRIMILSGISVSTEVSKDDTCWLTVAAACTAAALCLRLARKHEQHFSLHLVFIFFPDTLAAKAGFGRHASRKHRLVSWWLCERSDEEAGPRAGARNASPALLSPACARARSCPLVFSCCWGCRAGGVQPSVLHGAASHSICCVLCRSPWLPILISAPHCYIKSGNGSQNWQAGAGCKPLNLCICYILHLVLTVIKLTRISKRLESSAEYCCAKCCLLIYFKWTVLRFCQCLVVGQFLRAFVWF